jgi:NADH-quinone oxidoreductase subunit E
MLAIASQIILCLVLAALLGLIIGYLLGKANCPNATYKAQTPHDSHTHDDGDCGDTDDVKETAKDKTTAVSAASTVAAATKEADVDGAETNEIDRVGIADFADKHTDTQVDDSPSDDDKPVSLLSAPRGGEKDNLTRIKGIGLKIDNLLNSIGVYHFDQIAAWTEKEAAWIDHQVSFPGRALRDDWIGQAKILAKGEETEFSKRVDKGEVSSSKKD